MNASATNKGPIMNGRNRLTPAARRGLSLVEVMISLAISTFLLVAVGVWAAIQRSIARSP